MALKDDEILKELDTKLSFHCRDNHYSCVVAIMADDIDEGQVISCNGDVTDFMLNILAFANAIEAKTNFPFKKQLLKILQEDIGVSTTIN